MELQNARSADVENSIWAELAEDSFRQNLVTLEQRTNAVPMDPCILPITSFDSKYISDKNYVFPLEIEQQVADDFARLVAVEEGAQSVAAVCLEQSPEADCLTLRFASLDLTVNGQINTFLHNFSGILRAISILHDHGDCAKHVEDLLTEVIMLHHHRLLARLRSSKWEKPKYLSKSHKKPLWQDFPNLVHRISHLYRKNEKISQQQALDEVTRLATVYQDFDGKAPDHDIPSLMQLVKASHRFNSCAIVQDVAMRLENTVGVTPTPQIASAMKCLKQIQKIGGYRRICESLAAVAREYPLLFENHLRIGYLTPYSCVPTTIGYEAWAKSCHIHAEIQLAVNYDLLDASNSGSNVFLRPRCIGISKWLCFLCFNFLKYHGRFFPSKTHGRLYDQWTIPDLSTYKESIVLEYRKIISDINDAVSQYIQNEPELWRIEPMTSMECPQTPINSAREKFLCR